MKRTLRDSSTSFQLRATIIGLFSGYPERVARIRNRTTALVQYSPQCLNLQSHRNLETIFESFTTAPSPNAGNTAAMDASSVPSAPFYGTSVRNLAQLESSVVRTVERNFRGQVHGIGIWFTRSVHSEGILEEIPDRGRMADRKGNPGPTTLSWVHLRRGGMK